MVLASLPALAQEPRRYDNARFGFSVEIPVGFLPRDPPENEDGLQFDSQDGGATITASAIRNVSGNTLDSFMAMSNEGCVDHRPSYVTIHADWAVLSCRTPDGKVLYQRSVLRGPADDAVFTSVRVTYPAKDHDRWDAVAVAVARSMQAAPGG